MEDLLDLNGRVALITGAGQGVGRHVALSFAAHGAGAIVVNDLVAERAERVAEEILTLGVKALPVAADVTDPAAVSRMAGEVLETAGTVQILVNNAGIPPDGAQPGSLRPFVETAEPEWRRWIELNLFGVMHVTHSLLDGMIEAGYGRIVTVVSDAGRTGTPRMAAYGAAKAGAAGFMRCLASEIASDGVTANCVALGGVRTESILASMPPEALEAAARQYPTKRLGEPEEAAAMILFLASDAAAWITGQVYPVNGGFSFAL